MMPMSESLPRPKISVLLPAFNEEALIGDVIDTVHNSFRTVGLDSYEIIVCDNNSTDAYARGAPQRKARRSFTNRIIRFPEPVTRLLRVLRASG
jgi:glycosyltransferase involved in cell wall biosynthesis